MSTTNQKRPQLDNPDETLLEEHETAVDVILENGRAYDSIKERRGLNKSYDELSTVEKWEYAIDVVKMREGKRYDSAEELIKEIYDRELDLETQTFWNDDYQGDSVEVEEPEVNRLSGDPDRVTVQAEVEGEDGSWIEFKRIDFANRWEDFL